MSHLLKICDIVKLCVEIGIENRDIFLGQLRCVVCGFRVVLDHYQFAYYKDYEGS